MKKVSICIPLYNEAQNLPIAVQTVAELFAKDLSAYEFEIILTDNCSTDDTWRVANELASTHPNLKAYRFSRNFGYQNSVFAGLSLATGDAVVELDADLEDPPHVIREFVEKWEQGYDVAYGVRLSRSTPMPLKFLFRIFYKLLNCLSDLKIPENAGDFRLLDRKVVDVLKALPERNLYLRGLVSYLGFKQIAVPYRRDPRLSGKTKFRFMHYVVLAIDAVTAFSKSPLRLIGFAGAALFCLSILTAAYYVYQRLTKGTPVAGFTTLIVATLTLHSLTFMFLGIIGEYLSRVFDDAKNRPRVIISEAVNDPHHPKTL